jgi:transposase
MRDRLIRLATTHPDWAVGFADEVRWSRVAQPAVRAWTATGQPLRLMGRAVAKGEPKALACYGLLVRWWETCGDDPAEALRLRFVDGRPVSAGTTQYLAWCCEKLAAAGKTALLLVWDNASWHKSRFVKEWIAAHNGRVKERGSGVRIVPCFLPKKSPWLNAIEPKWVHGKRKVVEPERLLSAEELADRVCGVFGCAHEEHLSIPQEVA